MKKIILAIFVALIGSTFGEDLTVLIKRPNSRTLNTTLYFFTSDPERKIPEPKSPTYYTNLSKGVIVFVPFNEGNAAKWPEFKGELDYPESVIVKLSELGFQLINGWTEVLSNSSTIKTYSYYVFKKNP